MRIQNFIDVQGVIFPSTIAKFLLSKESIHHILNNFATKTGATWVEKPQTDTKCKRSTTLEVVQGQDKCVKIEGIFDDRPGISGPYLIKNNIVFYNQNEELLLVLMCPPFTNIPDNVSDAWVRKVIPFTYKVNFEIPEVVSKINYNDFLTKSVVSTLFSSEENTVLKLHRTYGAFTWSIEKITTDNTKKYAVQNFASVTMDGSDQH